MELLRKLVLMLFIVLSPHLVWAEAVVKRSEVDFRTVEYVYDEKEVYTISTQWGYLSQVSFTSKEQIVVPVSSFNSGVWEFISLTPYAFTIRQKENVDDDTNMVISTTITKGGKKSFRTYTFHLRAQATHYSRLEELPAPETGGSEGDDASGQNTTSRISRIEPIWKILFTDPKVKVKAAPRKTQVAKKEPDFWEMPPESRSCEYYWVGDEQLRPGIVCDNGKFTRLRFSPAQPKPVIYQCDPKHCNEGEVNYWRVTNDEIQIPGVYNILVLRFGADFTCLFNGKRIPPTSIPETMPVLPKVQVDPKSQANPQVVDEVVKVDKVDKIDKVDKVDNVVKEESPKEVKEDASAVYVNTYVP